jgi:glutathione peroxidase
MLACVGMMVGVVAFGVLGLTRAASDPPAGDTPDPFVLKHEMRRIDGTPQQLDAYKGKVVLIVNTASRCGLTPQYEALESLFRSYKDRGFVVLGFPANDFMGQEPGTNEEIARFCSERYSVSFPMFEKVGVKGEKAHPLFRQLASLPEPAGGEPSWNFTKYLVDREGRAVMRFEPRLRPNDEKVIAKIEELLGAGG